MDRRRSLTPPTIRTSFETTRISGQCLAEAYERLVPITRRRLHPSQGVELDRNVAPTMGRDDHA